MTMTVLKYSFVFCGVICGDIVAWEATEHYLFNKSSIVFRSPLSKVSSYPFMAPFSWSIVKSVPSFNGEIGSFDQRTLFFQSLKNTLQ